VLHERQTVAFFRHILEYFCDESRLDVSAPHGKGPFDSWSELFTAYKAKYPELATEVEQLQRRVTPAGWDKKLRVFAADAKGIAGRDASGNVITPGMTAQQIFDVQAGPGVSAKGNVFQAIYDLGTSLARPNSVSFGAGNTVNVHRLSRNTLLRVYVLSAPRRSSR